MLRVNCGIASPRGGWHMTTARLKIANPHDPLLAAIVQRTLDRKTKPQGSLGRLEGLALQLALIQGREQPLLASPQLVVFAADHGIAARGI